MDVLHHLFFTTSRRSNQRKCKKDRSEREKKDPAQKHAPPKNERKKPKISLFLNRQAPILKKEDRWRRFFVFRFFPFFQGAKNSFENFRRKSSFPIICHAFILTTSSQPLVPNTTLECKAVQNTFFNFPLLPNSTQNYKVHTTDIDINIFCFIPSGYILG